MATLLHGGAAMPPVRALVFPSLLSLALVAGCSAAAPDATEGSQNLTGDSTECLPTLDCEAPPLDPGRRHLWRHWVTTPFNTPSTVPHHVGRDLFVNPGQPQ